jgi:hypothetical protein
MAAASPSGHRKTLPLSFRHQHSCKCPLFLAWLSEKRTPATDTSDTPDTTDTSDTIDSIVPVSYTLVLLPHRSPVRVRFIAPRSPPCALAPPLSCTGSIYRTPPTCALTPSLCCPISNANLQTSYPSPNANVLNT